MSSQRVARQAAEALRAILEQVSTGELVAPAGMVQQLRGSLEALEVMGRPRRGRQRLSHPAPR